MAAATKTMLNMKDTTKKTLLQFLKKNKKAELIPTYMLFLEKEFDIQPVLFPKEKKIYQSLAKLTKELEAKGKLWRETEIKVQLGKQSVNAETQKVYICPFTGKVFGDNTHPNPQDAIYDWVSKCPENTERIGGLKVKRFYVSEDPEVIKDYIQERKEPIVKVVFSSALSGKLFNNKKSVIADFKKNYVRPMTLVEVQNQNRFEIEEGFVKFLQDNFNQDKITEFVEELSKDDAFGSYIDQWLE